MRMACFMLPVILLLGVGRPSAGETTAFKNVTLVPMTRGGVVPGQTVIVAEGRLQTIGPSTTVSIPTGATVIDGTGRFLMPGLADMHTHLNDAMFEYPFFNLFLAHGVTTIRDLSQGSPSSVLRYRREIESSRRLGPNILVAYPIWGNEADIVDLVASLRPLGYNGLKLNSFFSPAGFDAVMRKAKELRWYTLGHIPQRVGLDGVLAGGMNELSHIEELMIFELLDMDRSKVTDSESFDTLLLEAFHAVGKTFLNASAEEIRAAYADRVRRAVRKLEGHDLTLTTTMIVHEDTMNKLLFLERLKAAPHAKYTTPSFWKNVAAGEDKHQKMVVAGEERAWFLVYELQNMLVQELRKNDVPLVLGTDVGPTYLSLVPGFSVLDELRLLTQNGFSPYEAIALATRRAGEVAARMTDRNDFGTIEAGKRADLILLAENPLESIDNLRGPLGVMAGGRWLPRDVLQKLITVKSSKVRGPLLEAYSQGGCDLLLERYRRITENNLYNDHDYSAMVLIQIGYELLGAGHIDDALRVFRLNADEYREDWNAFDSYGEALLKAGLKDQAIKSYERAHGLDPSQENPRTMLKQLAQN